MSLRAGDSSHQSTTPATDTHQSLALPALCRGLATGHQKILDLGPAIGSNVSFFGQLPCSLYIADLRDTLFPGTPEGVMRRRDHFDELLSEEMPQEAGFDLILAWDLLNYMEPAELEILSRHLFNVSAPGAVLFSLIWTRATMPNKPLAFGIIDSSRLSYETDNDVQRQAPRYKEPDLGRALPDFGVESTFLLRNGIQEYLFTRHSPTAGGPWA